ncbi:hypothetical protein LZ012_07935 [Dechloromonas sp. XY25]|uniref:DUF3613 domain-containing protein n=1 Tax=Dechloromonas hankyongensis TaxID=2908002 RepID=A0ABS9K175_9RHOO|nr:hypothetical protein [Dechloromonas hankyongensis]MCG2576922.1 hypothetical protein [Dechloromonas hankyongensis]
MKHHSMLNSFCGLLIGLAGVSAAVNTPWAADVGMPVLSKWSAKTMVVPPQVPAAASSNATEESRHAKGAQGPIRRDYNDPMVGADAETLRRDLQMDRYPFNNRVSIP